MCHTEYAARLDLLMELLPRPDCRFLASRAFRHTERNIADTGLNLLLEICLSFETSEFATQFYQAYQLQLLQEVFAVMTGVLSSSAPQF